MGNARWDANDWTSYTKTVSNKSRKEIFTKREIDPALDPSKIDFRESVDSDANPESTPIILAVDETGSMGRLAEQIIKHDLGVIMKEIYDTKPVRDPHIMCMGVGDAFSDRAPLQVTQFEASVDAITQQVASIYLEANGGSNGGESYSLPWWFATFKVKTDAWRKRNKKGYLFTIGDECVLPIIEAEHIRSFMGVGCQEDIDTEKLLAVTQEYWNVFHLIIKPVNSQPVEKTWKRLLGEAAISVRDESYLAQGIVNTIAACERSAGYKEVGLVVHEDKSSLVIDNSKNFVRVYLDR